MNKQQLSKQVRAVLSDKYTAARWTAGGYMLRNKQSVHRDGFRIYQVKSEKGIRVTLEQQELLPLKLWRDATKKDDFLKVWQRRVDAAKEYQNDLKKMFSCQVIEPADYSVYPYLYVDGIL